MPDLRERAQRDAIAALIDEWRDRPTITRHSHKEQIEGIEDLVAALRTCEICDPRRRSER